MKESVAIITGASQGIGRATVVRLAPRKQAWKGKSREERDGLRINWQAPRE
jgi:NAD(P)-dependent dehydrogenase (short-subunit alcohol dehydrogenase family)